jgi:soluble lytic murein transglycosylase-like protein
MAAKIVIGVLLLLALVRPADAQIYTWRDANGTLVLSNVPQGGAAPAPKSFAVPASSGVRTTVYASPDRSRQYDGIIRTHAERQGVRPELVRAVVQVESAFNPVAISPKGAMGLMQLMPTTAEELGVGNPFNPEENIRGGVRYLRLLLDRYDNNEQLALAAYNAGPGAVDKYGEKIPPYRETRDYVSKITRLVQPIKMAGTTVYKITEVIDGREVVKYTDKKPQ